MLQGMQKALAIVLLRYFRPGEMVVDLVACSLPNCKDVQLGSVT